MGYTHYFTILQNIEFCIGHGLSVKSELPIIIPKLNVK